jgi:hypothetical protein
MLADVMIVLRNQRSIRRTVRELRSRRMWEWSDCTREVVSEVLAAVDGTIGYCPPVRRKMEAEVVNGRLSQLIWKYNRTVV